MTTKEQILGFFVLWAGPERNSLCPFRGMMYRGEFVRGREEASGEERKRPRKRGKKASGDSCTEAQNDGGTEAQNDGDTRWRHEVEKRARRHAIRRARRQEAARRGRRAARTREEVKYRKEGRQKRAERTGGRGRRCTEAEHECGWRGHGEGYKKRAAEELNLPPLTYRCCINRPGVWRPDAKSAAGWRSRRLGPGAECRTPNAECRMPGAGRRRQRPGPKAGTKTAASAMRRGDA